MGNNKLIARAKLAAAQTRHALRAALKTQRAETRQIDVTVIEERVLLSASPIMAPAADSPETTPQPTEITQIVIVDSSVEDYQQLMSDVSQDPAIKIILLDSDSDGIEQISNALSDYSSIESIHIISHGTDGAIQLGNTWLSAENLESYAGQIAGWGSSISTDGDLLIYGCDLAATDEGQFLIEALSQLTAADVAASTDLTGTDSLGGDWDLEFTVGTIDASYLLNDDVFVNWQGVLATITVDTTLDENDGDTSSIANLIATSGGSGLSLREAIIAANNTAGDDTIILGAGTFIMSISGNDEVSAIGDYDILTNITISGDSMNTTSVDANGVNRIFDVISGSLTLNDLEVTGGFKTNNGAGIDIASGATVTINSVDISKNYSSSSQGGGVYNLGTFIATDSMIRNNIASNSIGGGLLNSGTATLTRVSVNGNVSYNGAGIEQTAGTLNLTNVTVSSNYSTYDGAGLRVGGGVANIDYSTFANNNASTGWGGGIRQTAGTVNLSNSIVADNLGYWGGADISGTIVSGGYNLIEDTNDTTGTVGTDITGVDPGLAVLAHVGNNTYTHAIDSTSAAYNAGSGTPPTTDQRGMTRDGSADIGAYEFIPMASPVNSVPGSQTINEDNSLVFSSGNSNAITISDTDEGALETEITLTTTFGTLSLSTTTGLTFIDGDGTSDITMTFTGTIASINAAMNGLIFAPTANYNGSATLTVRSKDGVLHQINIDSSLEGFYTFEDSGNLGNDSGPVGTNNGTVVGATGVVDGTRGNVLSLDGNDYIQIANTFGDPSDVTLAAWVNLTSDDTLGSDVISLGDDVILSVFDGKIWSAFWNGSSWESLTFNTTIAGDGWHHVAYTVDQGTNFHTIYLDGVAVASNFTSTTIAYVSGTDTFIGKHANGSSSYDFTGLIDDAYIFTRALDSSEIAALAATLTDVDSVGITISAINDAPAGVPTITGTVTEDQTLTAVTSGISDVDGLGTFSYQWLRDGSTISGATSSTYTLGDADVGTQISVSVSYTDSDGTAEGPLTSTQTSAVANVNDAPVGAPTITGTTTEDQTLTAVTSGISDVDGLGTFSYQWLRNGSAISGANSTTYTLGDADVGAQISIRVTYTDGYGTPEAVTSSQTSAIANVNDAPVATNDPGDYNTLVTSLTPTGYWQLGEGSGSTATDESGTNNGTYSGVTYSQPGAIAGDADTAVSFNGFNSYLELAHNAAYLTDNGTVQFWFNADSIGSSMGLFSKDSGGLDTGGHLSISVLSSGQIQARLQSTSSNYYVTSSASVSSGSWHHVAFSYGSNGMTLFLDGQLVDTDVYTGGLATTSGGIGNFEPIAIGASTYTSGNGTIHTLRDFFDGSIDEVAMFNTQLSGETIQDIYASAIQNYTFAEDTTLNVSAVNGVLANDFDLDGDTLTVSLVSGPSNAASFTLNSDGSFSYAAVANSSGTDTFTYRVNDGTTNSNTATVTLTVTAVNDAPVVNAPGSALSATEQIGLTIQGTGFSVSDADEAGSGATATLTVGEGILTVAAGNSGISVTAGNGTGSVTVTGTIAQINNLLTGGGTGTIVYLNSSNDPLTSTTLTVTVNDLGNTGADPGLTGNGSSEEGTNSQTINISAINDAPTNAGSLPSDITVLEDVSGNVDLSAIDLSDVDHGGGSLTVTLATSTGGNLSATSGGGVTVGGNGTGILTLTGTLSNLNAYLNTASNIQYLHGTPHLNGNDADTIGVNFSDNGNTGSGGGGNFYFGYVNVDITAVNDAPIGIPAITGTATEDQVLSAVTSGISDADGLGTFSYQWLRDGATISGATATTYTLGDADIGALISVQVNYTDSDGTAEGPLTSVQTAAVTNVNDAPVGLPIITGTTTEDQTLTADASGISDADGLGTFSYQWLRDGSTISGATATTYTLGDADPGALISVQVSYTDGNGTAETVTSIQTAAITNVNDVPVGIPTISGTTTEDQILTAVTSGISDADGLGTFSYQWLRDGGTISGATSTTYTLGDNDVGAQMSVEVTYTDGNGTAEGPLTSVQTAAVTNVNDTPAGLPIITGTTTEDQTLTADASGISDADGLGTFNYQWLRDGSTISGATATTYTLGDADVAALISVQVSYTDGNGTAETVTSIQTAAITNVNDVPVGIPTISGTTTEDQILTAITSGISDADGLGTFSYQWLRNGATVSGATSTTYSLGDADVGAQMSVEVTYTDGNGTAEGPLTSVQTAAITNVNDVPVGIPTISGTTTEDQILTADASGISDADGLGTFSYQWLRDGATISGATSTIYTLGDNDVGAQMSVEVTYTDGNGTAEGPLTSVQTAAITNVNDTPVGLPIITGTTTEDQTLTADASGISDADGLGTFNYQWLRDGSTISGATATTYTLGDADVAALISVQVNYTDGNGTAETVTSIQTAAITNVNDVPVGIPTISGTTTEDQILTAITSGISDADGLGTFSYQWLRDGATISGATATTYSLGDNDVGAQMSVEVTYTDGNGTAEGPLTSVQTAAVTNVNDTPVGLPIITGTTTEDQTLTADASGISDADGLGTFSYQWLRDGATLSGATATTYTLGDADVAALISVQVSYTDGNGTAETVTSIQTAAITNVNDVPVGIPTISGTADEDQILTAVTSGISDADGLGPFSYQWLRDGSTISGATATTYTLGDADVGALISVQVNYTDALGTAEGPLTSLATSAVTNVNDAPIGLPIISGTTIEDQTLTADTSGITDADGLGTFSYQWLRDGSTIGGATATTFTLGDTDIGSLISVRVSYTDGMGTDETVTSIQTTPITNLNDAPVVNDQTFSINENSSNTTTVGTVIASDIDTADSLTFSITSGTGATAFSIDSSTGIITVADQAQLDFESASFLTLGITVTDNGLPMLLDTATLTININDINDAPVGVSEQYFIDQFQEVIVSQPGLLANDFDDDGDALSAVLILGPSSGVISINANGAFTYTPDTAFYGIDSFVYAVTDGTLSTSVTVQISVNQSGQSNPTGDDDNTSESEPEPETETETEPETESESETETMDSISDLGNSNPVGTTTGATPDSPTAASVHGANPTKTDDASASSSTDPTAQEVAANGYESSSLGGIENFGRDSMSDSYTRTLTSEIDVSGIGSYLNDSIVRFPLSVFQSENPTTPLQSVGETSFQEIVVGTSAISSTALSVGYVIWLLRGGSLLASLASSVPSWSAFDPLLIVNGASENEDSESLVNIVDSSDFNNPAEPGT